MFMYGSGYIFSKFFFIGWVMIGIIWIFGFFIGVGLFFVWESWVIFIRICKYIWKDLIGKSYIKIIYVQEVVVVGIFGDQILLEKVGFKEEVRFL